MSFTRNEFLRVLGLSATLTGISGLSQAKNDDPDKTEATLKLGLASYTLRKFTLSEVIRISQHLELTSVALKSIHMPLESTAEDIKKMAGKINNAGLHLYGAGVIYMKTAKEVESAFTYARHAGLETIIGVPNHELLPVVEEHVKKYNIKLAIHNHGPGDDLYSSPTDVYNKIKDLDKRIGLCLDVGHVVRIGQDPVAMIEKYKDRLYDVHMKDMNKAEPDGKAVEAGRGIIDIPKVIKALKKIDYQGIVAFEYEADPNDPLMGLAESVGYIRGIMKMV